MYIIQEFKGKVKRFFRLDILLTFEKPCPRCGDRGQGRKIGHNRLSKVARSSSIVFVMSVGMLVLGFLLGSCESLSWVCS